MGVGGAVHVYLFTGEVAMHLFYGFDPLISQDTLQHLNHKRKNLSYINKQTKKIYTDLQVKRVINDVDNAYLSYLIQDNIK